VFSRENRIIPIELHSGKFHNMYPGPLIEMIVALQSNNNQSGFGRQRRKFVLLSASHFTRVSTFTISISGPGFHIDVFQ